MATTKDVKKLFRSAKRKQPNKTLASASLDAVSRQIESPSYVQSFLKDRDRFKPNIDFTNPANFVKFGSAEEYYKKAIENIYRTYPYDGSLREKYDWHNSSSYFDNYFFEYEYPRVNGYVAIGQTYTVAGTAADDGVDKIIEPTNPQYISVKGGPHGPQAPIYDPEYSKALTVKDPDQKANIYNTTSSQAQNLTIDGATGNTVEFWLKLPTDSSTTQPSPSYAYFDLWNESTDKTSGGEYGRLLLETRLDRTLDGTYTDDSLFHITYMSGTAGAERAPVGPTTLLTSQNITLSDWNHYAFVVQNNPTGSDHLLMSLYINGNLVDTVHTGSQISEVKEGPFNANIGAYRYNPASNLTITNGEGSISGSSFDEFRYWKSARNQKEVNLNWFTQIAGGTNTDVGTPDSKFSGSANPVDLGVYYKFNEGITGISSQDQNILDYSGRLSNGVYNNYASSPAVRFTESAIVEASAADREFKDPIIYNNHPDILSLVTEKLAVGVEYDSRNTMGIYKMMPNWILDEDSSKNSFELKKLTQIVASYFDELFIQTEQLNKIKDNVYLSGSVSGSAYKPLPFANHLLESRGFVAPEIFSTADILPVLANRDDVREFKTELVNVKNQIYTNIYNNLDFINKSKGTEKAIRNLVRCFGVDDNLYALSFYANNADITLNQSITPKIIPKNFVNFATASNFSALVYQSTASSNTNSSMYITGSSTTSGFDAELGFTVEAEVIFPQKPALSNPRKNDSYYAPVSASLFGMHTVPTVQSDEGDTTWADDDYASFQVYAVREENTELGELYNSSQVKFVLTGTNVNTSTEAVIPFLTSSVFDEVYEDEKWNFAVKVYPSSYPNLGIVSGTSGYTVEFHGYNTQADIITNSFVVTGSVTSGAEFLSRKKRVYIGAHRTNYTGSLLVGTDVKMSSCRYWALPLEKDEIISHAIDSSNYGLFTPAQSAYLFQNYGVSIPKIRTLALSWDFNNVTGSDANGEFTVEDFASGSGDSKFRDDLSDLLLKQHTGRGLFFYPSETNAISKQHVYSFKQQVPENLDVTDTIKILSRDDEMFTQSTRPITFSYAVEKSMYQAISEEMLNLLACSAEASGLENLIGDPINKYRPEYKLLTKIREIFYERIGNTPDLDKYLEYYKWLDTSVSLMINQLVPASSEIESVKNIVESHVFERSKYAHKFPTFEFGSNIPEGTIHGVGELTYDWEFGHAPLSLLQNNNCNWWNKKVNREDSILATGIADVDVSRANIHSASLQVFNRKFGSPYKITGLEGGGILKTDYNKKSVVMTQINPFDSVSNITFNTTTFTTASVVCSDDTKINPNLKRKADYQVELSDNTNTQTKFASGLVSPYSFYSASLGHPAATGIPTGFQAGPDHLRDYYVDTKEVPMQGPFTERHVGGYAHRHVGVNTTASLNPLADNTHPHKFGLPQAWYLYPFPAGSEIYYTIVNPTFVSSRQLRADFSRETIAKRPVNIKNIQTITSSIINDYGALNPIGNYTHNYEIVQIADRSVNNRYFVENNGILATPTASISVFGLKDYEVPDRGRHASIMVNRFSAPGGPEINSAGFLDFESETYSVYNALPFRNLTVRQPLNSFLTAHSLFGGYSSLYGEPSASYHKVQRNGAKRIEYTEEKVYDVGAAITTASSYDNFWVQHMIPQSDLQYNWITASAIQAPFGYSQPDLSNASEASTDLVFVSASLTGAHQVGGGMIPVDFVGLNSTVLSTLSTFDNLIETTSSTDLFASNAEISSELLLNSINLNRNGAGGFSSWKQIRNSYNPFVRYWNKNNYISIMTQSFVGIASGNPKKQKSPKLFRDPAVSFNHKPLKHNFTLTNGSDIVVKHTYGNNLHTFNSKTINKLIDFEAQRGDEVYDDLKRIYIDKDLGDFSPIQTFNGLQYSEAIFPRNSNTGLARTRSRENYTVSSGSANFDLRIGDSVAFWKDNVDNRLRTKNVAINASNQTIYSASNSAPAFKGGLFGMIDLSAWPLDSEEPFFDYYMYSASSGDATDQGYDPYAWIPMDTSLASRKLDPDQTGGDRWKNLSKNGELSNAAYIYGLYDYAIGGKSEQLDYPNALRSGRLPQFLTARRNNVRPSGSLQFEYPNLVWSGSFPYGQRFDNAYNENPGTTNLAFMTVQCSASLHLIPPYRTDVLSGKRPWYNSYEEYSQDIKLMSKNYSILPEFRITEHMDYYLDQGFSTENNKFLDLVGCSLDNTSSANTETGGFQNQFFTLYSNSDFMSKFVELKNDHKKGMAASPSKIRLKVNAVKKLLPYNGFYPALRSVQLGSMFSSSYAPYISGSRAFADNEAPYQRLAALNQPFFAPGIFFNTIKSGIAVDYAVHTGSAPRSLNDFSSFVASIVGVDTEYSCSNLALGLIADEPNYVFPFEAILNPNGYLPLTASQNEATYDDVLDGTGYASGSVYFVYPHFTSSLDVANAAAGAVDPWLGYTSGLAQRPEHFFTWHGESDIKYSLAANNFFAEVENFFLERQAPTSFISKAEKDFKTMASGNVYIMDVVLSKTDKFISYEGPSGSFKFHPFTGSSGDDADGSNRLGRGRLINPYVSARGMHYGPPYLPHLKMLGSPEGEQAWFEDPCFAPHTPPYFYGDAVARIEFRAGYDLEPGESRKYSLQDILANAEIKYFNTNTRAFDFANNKEVVGILAGNYPAYRNQMQISSSVDLLGSLTLKQTKYSSQQDEDGNFIPDGVDTTILQDSQDSWVIESKFECPSINLYNMDVDSLGAAPGNGNEKYYTRGIWKGYGTPPRGSEGIFLQLREAMPQTSYSKAQTLTGSLIDVCGFKPDKVRVGEIASTRQISEAVVAIPVNSDGEFYNVDSAMFLQQLININNGDPAIKKDQFGATEDIKSTSISDMIKKMKKFYIPPQFDPINNSKAKPVVMYIFEFNHELTKTDLADIWQNLMPEIATKAEKDSSVIEHNLRSKFEFFGNEGYSNSPFMSLNNDIRWMVFKVKQRGKNNYTNVTKKSEVSSGFSFTANKELAKFTSAPDKELPYSYNWPYDFFSLVELAEVESTVEFAPPNAPNVSKIQGLIESTETKVGSMGTGLVNPIMQGTSTTDQAPTQNSATTPVGAANLISPPIASPKTSTANVDDAELTEF